MLYDYTYAHTRACMPKGWMNIFVHARRLHCVLECWDGRWQYGRWYKRQGCWVKARRQKVHRCWWLAVAPS